jgi:hypothetical protein
MGMVHAYQKGDLNTSSIPKDVLDQVKKMAGTLKPSDAKKFAKTKHKGLPEKVTEGRISFKEYLAFQQS